jgi:hypothetical protein
MEHQDQHQEDILLVVVEEMQDLQGFLQVELEVLVVEELVELVLTQVQQAQPTLAVVVVENQEMVKQV